jgi:hypothetical protein
MTLTFRQRALLHQVLRDFDRESGAAAFDPNTLPNQLGAPLDDLAAGVTVLVAEGYLDPPAGDDPWRLAPTDKGVLTAMGLG